MQQDAVGIRRDDADARGGQLERPRVVLRDHGQRGRRRDRRAAGDRGRLVHRRRLVEDPARDQVHGHAGPVAKAIIMVLEEVEVDAEARVVDADLAEHAELGERLDDAARGQLDAPQQLRVAQRLQPVPGLDRSRSAAVAGQDDRGRALARRLGPDARHDLGPRVDRRDPPRRQPGAGRDPAQLRREVRRPAVERLQRALTQLVRARRVDATGREDPLVAQPRPADPAGERLTQRAPPRLRVGLGREVREDRHGPPRSHRGVRPCVQRAHATVVRDRPARRRRGASPPQGRLETRSR